VTTTANTSGYTANSLYLAPIVSGANSGNYNATTTTIQYNSSSDSSGAVNGIQAKAELFGQGGANQVAGIRAIADSLANGGAYTNTQSLYAGLFKAFTSGTSTFSHVIGIKIETPADNGNVDYQSGLYVADQANAGSATITTQDAIHIEGHTGTDTSKNGICFGNGGSGINACIYSSATNKIDFSAPAGITMPGIISTGTKFTASGCSNSSTVGGATAGKFTSGTTGTCTVVITMNGATGLTAPNGWTCHASDQTTPANQIVTTTSSATTATISGSTTSGDVISFSCTGY
jgi:hypothetical protein